MITEEEIEKDRKLFNECASRLKEIGKENLCLFINTLQEGNTNTLEFLFNKYISKAEQLETEKQNLIEKLEEIVNKNAELYNSRNQKEVDFSEWQLAEEILSYMKGEEK